MARSREPTNLIEAKGRKHLTKAEIEERQESEIKVPTDRIEAPVYLTTELKEEFNKIAKQLTDLWCKQGATLIREWCEHGARVVHRCIFAPFQNLLKDGFRAVSSRSND